MSLFIINMSSGGSSNKESSKKTRTNSNDSVVKDEQCENNMQSSNGAQKRPLNYDTDDEDTFVYGNVKRENEPMCSSALQTSKRPKQVKIEKINVENSDLIELSSNDERECSSSPSGSASSTRAQISEQSFPRREKKPSVMIDEEAESQRDAPETDSEVLSCSTTSDRNDEALFNEILEVTNEDDNALFDEDSNGSEETNETSRNTEQNETENERLNNFINTARGRFLF